MTLLKHDQDDALRFTESVSDFGALIIERGPEAVMRALRTFYPQQAEELMVAMNRPLAKQAALFRRIE